MKLDRLPIPRYQNEFIRFGGGLDLTTPTIELPSGFLRSANNYEEDLYGGYRTLTGYERFDGRASPSAALVFSLPYSNAGTAAVGTVLVGGTSGATATVIGVLPGKFVVTRVTGTFVAETANLGVVLAGAQTGFGGSMLDLAVYRTKAADIYRALIAAVPGAGAIRGVWYYQNTVYAFRDNVGAGVGLYKSSATGWQAVALGFEVSYSAGNGTKPSEGTTIAKGATSAVLARLTVESGSFGAGTAAGRMIFASVTAGPFTAGALTAGMAATVVSQATITLPTKGGRFEFVNAAFTGSLASYRMYGVDGLNRGFEFDGTVFVPIATPLDATRKPSHLSAHASQLFYAYESSVLNSNLGDPYNWTTGTGTLEIAVSDTVTGFMNQPGSDNTPALAVYCRNRTYVLYGRSSSTYQMTEFNDQQGALPYTIQKVNTTFVFDDRGVVSLQTAQEFGNFLEASLSNRVKPLLDSKRSRVVDSHVSRDKQQYRLFFNDGTGAYFLATRKQFSMMPVAFPNPVLCSAASEVDGGGDEVIYFGSDNGFVYQMERGTGFDGADISANITFTFDFSKSYRALKRYRHLTFEAVSTGYNSFSMGYDLSYLSKETLQPDTTLQEVAPNAPVWDSFVWDNFTWDGDLNLTQLHFPITGNGQNLAVKISSNGNYLSPLRFNGCFLEYSTLRMLR